MLYMNSMNIVHGSKKRWKHAHLSYISEKIEIHYQLVVAPPAYFIDVLLFFIHKCLFGVTDCSA